MNNIFNYTNISDKKKLKLIMEIIWKLSVICKCVSKLLLRLQFVGCVNQSFLVLKRMYIISYEIKKYVNIIYELFLHTLLLVFISSCNNENKFSITQCRSFLKIDVFCCIKNSFKMLYKNIFGYNLNLIKAAIAIGMYDICTTIILIVMEIEFFFKSKSKELFFSCVKYFFLM